MSNPLVIVFGANGGVGSMLMGHLVGRSALTVVTCGRKQCSPGVRHYPWSFGLLPPIKHILEDYPDCDRVVALYSAIAWPRCDDDIEANIAALTAVMTTLPARALFLSISSFIVSTPAQSLYSRLKRRAEEMCNAHGGVNIRLGLIDAAKPFGQMLAFARLARLAHLVPVPFPDAQVILSTEDDVASEVIRLVEGQHEASQKVVEVCSAKLSFIDAVRRVAAKHASIWICVPVPDLVTRSLLSASSRFAPHSWLSERLRGLEGFSVL